MINTPMVVTLVILILILALSGCSTIRCNSPTVIDHQPDVDILSVHRGGGRNG